MSAMEQPAARSGCFFFQAEDGIRDVAVTGVQTCALPIYRMGMVAKKELLKAPILGVGMGYVNVIAIDRSNRDRAVESLKIATERLRSGISFGDRKSVV